MFRKFILHLLVVSSGSEKNTFGSKHLEEETRESGAQQ